MNKTTVLHFNSHINYWRVPAIIVSIMINKLQYPVRLHTVASLFTFLMICSTVTYSSELTLQPLDFKQGLVRLTYDITDGRSGQENFIWPDRGFNFSSKPFIGVSIFEANYGNALEFNWVRAPRNKNSRSLNILYKDPVPSDGYQLKIKFDALIDKMGVDKSGRYFLEFSTRESLIIKIPEQFYIVYTNFPVLIYQNHQELIIKMDNGRRRKERKVLIKLQKK